MNTIFDQRTRNGQVFPFPGEGEIVYETPPCLIWLRKEEMNSFHVSLRQNGRILWEGDTDRNYIIPDRVLSPGTYEWNLRSGSLERGWRSFVIAEEAVTFLRPDARTLYERVPDCRPRMLFSEEDIPNILSSHEAALETLKRNTALALSRSMPQPPMFHRDPQALPYREYFGLHRDDCDRDLVACSLAHALLRDEQAGEHAKKLFLTLCDWNSEGPCSLEGPWGDEIGLSHARCFPSVFDLLYDLLSEKERTFAARVTAAYAYQCERRLSKLDFCQNPGNSHAGRLPAYLGEAAMALKGTGVVEEEVLIRWLNLAVEVYGGIFPYFGRNDGGWAEGMFYASSYTKWFLPFFSAVERFSGVSFLKRPFYQRFNRYLQHFCPPDWEIHPFGDGYWCHSDDPEWPGFFSQNPWHLYAERYGSDLLRSWSKKAQQQELFKLHLLDVFLPEGTPDPHSLAGEATKTAAFPESGYVSLHTDPTHPEKELAVVARCSPFGCISHQHADQGSFALLAGGTALISPSGYFGRAFGTRHHREWTRRSKAHNTLLIDGMGQISEDRMDNGPEDLRYTSTGKVLSVMEDASGLHAEIDPSGAYTRVSVWTRRFDLSENTLIVTDHVELKDEGSLTYCLHSLSRPEQTSRGMELERNGYRLKILPQGDGLQTPEISDVWDVDLNAGEPEQYHVSMPPQYHMYWKTEARRIHDFCVRFEISRK